MSAHNCGCDPEEHWQCADYPSCSYGKVIATLQAGIDAINNDDTLERLLFEAQPMSELTDVGARSSQGSVPDMTMNDYQQALHTYKPGNYSWHALGLVGELGEVLAELTDAVSALYIDGRGADIERAVSAVKAAARVADMVKKQEHHDTGKANPEAIKKELGDVLWYVTAVAGDYGLTLQDVAEANIAKLRARYPRGFEKGGGIRNGVPESSAVGRDNAPMSTTTNEAYERACEHIYRWYQAGERNIALSPQMFKDYSDGVQVCSRWVNALFVATVPSRRLAYKAAIVYVADGWY